MNIICDTYIFYGDIYFIQNFLIKLTILFLIVRVSKKEHQISVAKIVFISMIGTLFEIIGLICVKNYTFFLIVVHLLEIPTMLFFLQGKDRNQLVKSIILGYLFTMIINSVLEAFWNLFGKSGHYLILLLLSCLGVIFGTIHYLQWKKYTKGVYSVELVHGETSVVVKAFYDSGNRLQDPYTKNGVHIISEKLLKELSLKEETKVYIPYTSLGNSNGLMEVYYIDFLQIYGPKNTIKQQKIPVGVATEELFLNKSYKMILNEEVF